MVNFPLGEAARVGCCGVGAMDHVRSQPRHRYLVAEALQRAWDIVWGIAGAVPVRLKIMGMVLGIIWLLGLGMLISMRSTLESELAFVSNEHGAQILDLVTRGVVGATVLTGLLGIAAATVLTFVLTRPIMELVDVVDAVGRGDLSQRGRVWARDEIGRLTEAFNGMIESLHRSQADLRASHAELLRRNQELSTLNAIAATVNRSPELQGALDEALATVLAVTDLDHGEVCVLDAAGRLVSAAENHARPAQTLDDAEALWLIEGARSAARDGQFELVHREGRVRLAVPLAASERILGVMMLTGPASKTPTEDNQALLRAAGNQIGTAVEKARLWDQLREKEKVRAGLLQKVITAQEEERKRIARELHDETSQALTSLTVGLKLLEGTADPEQMRARTSELRELAASTLRAVHLLAVELRPSTLDDLGLVAAVARYCRTLTRRGLEVDFHVAGMDDTRLAPETETAVYRIIQEALTTVARHAEATTASVVLERRGDTVVAIVEDNGNGFDVDRMLDPSMRERSLGLYGMRERAALVGARLTIESSPGSGASVFVEAPLGELAGAIA